MKTFAGRKLSRTSSHRLALLRNMTTSLLQYERIQTTVPKAKELVRFAEKVITVAKKENLNAHKTVAALSLNREIKKKLFQVLVPRYISRSGGYTQIIRTGQRAGDAAPMAVVRLIP